MTTRQTVSWPHLVLDGIVSACALLMLNAYVLDLLSLPLAPLLPVTLTLIELAVIWRLLKLDIAAHDRHEAVGLLVTVGGVFLFFLLAAYPTFYPPSHSVDAVHHYLLIRHIFENQALPHDMAALAPYLGEMVAYPFGSHLLVALLAQALGAWPLDIMHPFMALVRALTAAYVFLMAYRWAAATRGRTLVALCAPALLFVASAYFAGSLIGQQYYFAMVFAELLLAAGLWRRATVLVPTLAALALALTYPAWLPVSMLGFLALVVASTPEWRGRWRRIVGFGAPLLALLLLFLPARVAIGGDVLRWEGGTVAPNAAAFGWPLLVLAITGVGFALTDWRERWPVLLFLGVCLAQSGAMLVLADVLHGAARYHYYKSLYLLVYPLAVLGALAIAGIVRLIGREQHAGPAAAAALAAVLLTAAGALKTTPNSAPFQALSRDETAVARWARAHVDVTQVGYRSQHGITSYWLHAALLGNPREGFPAKSMVGLYPMTYDEWINGGAWPRYLITFDADQSRVDGEATMLYRSGSSALLERSLPEPEQPTPQRRLAAVLGDVIAVDGYSSEGDTLAPGGTLELTVYWRVQSWPRTLAPLEMYAHLLDSGNGVWGKSDHKPLDGRYPTQRWPVGVVNSDRFAIALPADLPPGRYVVKLGLRGADVGKDVSITALGGLPIARLLLGPFKAPRPTVVERPGRPSVHVFGDQVTLLGCDLDATGARAGSTLPLRLYWQAAQPMDTDYTAFVHLVGQEDKPLAQCDRQPGGVGYPTSIWNVQEIVADECPLPLPSTLPPGAYRLRVGLYNWQTLERLAVAGGDSVDLATVQITAP